MIDQICHCRPGGPLCDVCLARKPAPARAGRDMTVDPVELAADLALLGCSDQEILQLIR